MRVSKTRQRPVVSVGSFCLASAAIESAGVSQPSYPFDDIFSSMAIVIQCLEDDFTVFLDQKDYIALEQAENWVQRVYRESFGQQITFAHHDMSLDTNMASFRRKVDRFKAIRPEDNPLFVFIDYAVRMPRGDEFCRLRRSLTERFGECGLLVISFGSSEPDAPGWGHPGILFRHRMLQADSRVDGVRFTDAEDNEAVSALIMEAMEATKSLRPTILRAGVS